MMFIEREFIMTDTAAHIVNFDATHASVVPVVVP